MSKVLVDRELLEKLRDFTMQNDGGLAGSLRGSIDSSLAEQIFPLGPEPSGYGGFKACPHCGSENIIGRPHHFVGCGDCGSKSPTPSAWQARTPPATDAPGKFRMGDRVKKLSGGEWVGHVCGTYSTTQTPEGYCVESEAHRGSVQIYPAKALELMPDEAAE